MEFEWNSEKNEWLKKEREISFETIIFHLAQDDLWKVSDHPEQNKYPGQRVYYIKVNDYIYMVPQIKEDKKIFLKTIIPSRKATRDYMKESEKKNEVE